MLVKLGAYFFSISSLYKSRIKSMNSLLSLKLPTEANDHKLLGNVIADSDVLAIAQAAQQYHGLTVVVTADTRHALSLEKNCANSAHIMSAFFLIGKPCLMIVFLRIKILSPPV